MSKTSHPSAVEEPLLLDIKQVAAMLSISEKSIRRLLDAGKFPRPVRIGRLLRWRYKDIVAYVNKL